MIYQYEAPDGRIVEYNLPMAEADSIGSYREIDGVRCRRLPSAPATLMNDAGAGWVDIVSPRGWGQGATKDGSGFAKRYDSLGRPVYANRAEFDNAIAKANDHGERVAAVRARDYDITTGL